MIFKMKWGKDGTQNRGVSTSGPGQFLAKVVLQKSHSLSTLGCISASKELINCCFFDGHIDPGLAIYIIHIYIYMCVCVCV